MSPGIVISPNLINSLVLLAVERGNMEIYSHADHLPDVRRFFDNDPLFEIIKIEHMGDTATIFFGWRRHEKEPENER